MTFVEIILEVESYIKIQGAGSRFMVKKFINDSIRDFLRHAEWQDAKVKETLVLDGSESYDVDDVFDNYFWDPLELFNASGERQTKVDYERYITLASKSGYWSVIRRDLYVTGDIGDYTCIFKSPGEKDQFPLVNDSDEIDLFVKYSDVIVQWAVMKFYRYLGDDESYKAELDGLNQKLIILKQNENRINKIGQDVFIGRT